MAEDDDRSTRELFASVTADMADLTRKEFELARSELAQKLSLAKAAAAGAGAGAALLLAAFLCVIAAIVVALSNLMPPAWAALVVGVVCALVGFSLLRTAMKVGQARELAPKRLARQVRKDAEMLKEHMR